MNKAAYYHHHQQQGSTIVMVLTVMIGLLFSSMVLFKSTDITALIAGNIATKTVSSTMGDIGARSAVTALNGITNLETPTATYYPTQQPLDSDGLPTTVEWDSVPSQVIQGYNIQYVIERLCSGTLPIANPDTQCTNITSVIGGSKKSGAANIGTKTFYYRATVRITGGKQANSFIQVMLVQ